uniref:Uncharacterized protein n=1 Tax=Oncorhynchus tshawytscha TaxID=74940 RepID=A0AAZ3PGU2_ONCTS
MSVLAFHEQLSLLCICLGYVRPFFLTCFFLLYLPCLQMTALCRFWWLKTFTASEDDHTSSVRQCLSGHKRRAKCILLAILPRPLQSAQGYPICTSICWSLSTGIRQDDIDEEKQQTWVEAGSLAMGCLTGPNPSLLTLVV